MDLEAAHLANSRAARLARFGMLACFVLAGGMLIASLAAPHSGGQLSAKAVTKAP